MRAGSDRARHLNGGKQTFRMVIYGRIGIRCYSTNNALSRRLQSRICGRSICVDQLREIQIACSVELAWLSLLRRKTTFVGWRAQSGAWGIGIIFGGVDFEGSRVVVITPVPVELAAVRKDHSVSSICGACQ